MFENYQNSNQSSVTSDVASDLNQGAVEMAPASFSPVSPVPTNIKGGKKIWVIIAVIFFIVILGVAGWWYYAYGQTMMLMRDLSWNWGQNEMINYQQKINFDLNIKNQGSAQDNSAVMSFLGDDLSLGINSDYRYLGADGEGSMTLSISGSGQFDNEFNLAGKKIGDKFYFKSDWRKIEEISRGIINFGNISEDTWFELPANYANSLGADVPENMFVDEKKVATVNKQIDDYLQKIKQTKIFSFKDSKQRVDSSDGQLKKIEFIINPDKLGDLMLFYVDFQIDLQQTFYEGSLENTNLEEQKKDMLAEFEKFKKEKPQDWENIKAYLQKIKLFVLINPKTKNISGFEIYVDDLNVKSDNSNVLVNGQIQHLISSIEAYTVAPPKEIEVFNLASYFIPSGLSATAEIDTDNDALPDTAETYYGTDPNNPDSDGDSYFDGIEVQNGYNPLGDGLANTEELINNNYAYQQAILAKSLCEESAGVWGYDFNRNNIADLMLMSNKCEGYNDATSCQNDKDCFFYDSQCWANVCQCPGDKIFNPRQLTGCM